MRGFVIAGNAMRGHLFAAFANEWITEFFCGGKQVKPLRIVMA